MVVLDHSREVAQGGHGGLMGGDGLYGRLAKLQFSADAKTQ
jgi:hypothetical protein